MQFCRYKSVRQHISPLLWQGPQVPSISIGSSRSVSNKVSIADKMWTSQTANQHFIHYFLTYHSRIPTAIQQVFLRQLLREGSFWGSLSIQVSSDICIKWCTYMTLVLPSWSVLIHISNKCRVTTPLVEHCVLKFKKQNKNNLPNQNARLHYFSLRNKKRCPFMPGVCSSSTSVSWQGLGLCRVQQLTIYNPLTPWLCYCKTSN